MSDVRVLEVLGQSAGGVGRHVAEVVGALDGRGGLRIDIAGPGDLRYPMPKPVIPVPIPGGASRGHPAAVRRLRSIIRGGGYDVVHSHGLRACVDGSLAARFTGTPGIATLHNVLASDVSGRLLRILFAWVEPAAVMLTELTFVPSEDMALHLRRIFPPAGHKIEVLHAGVAPAPSPRRERAAVRAELGVPEGGHLVVTVARLHPQKSLHVMLRALAALPTTVTLAIVGEGPLETELRTLARALGVEPRVLWLGFQPEAVDYIAAADVFCLSSAWEAIPLAAQEAVQLSIPVVATAVGGLPELISDGESGRLVPVGDHGALGRALAEVLDRPDLARKLAQRARDDYAERFSRDHILARLRDVYIEHASDR